MKRYIIYFFALCMMFTLASCDKDEPALPDPPETETLEEGAGTKMKILMLRTHLRNIKP